MFDITFPEHVGQPYWNIHFKYVLYIFQELGCDRTYPKQPGFVILVNRKTILVDYNDDANTIPKCDIPIFKFHCTKNIPRVHPFPSVSFCDSNRYKYHLTNLHFNVTSNQICNRQRAYGNAKDRRNNVQAVLIKKYGDRVLTNIVNESTFLNSLTDAKLYIHVPGFCNNMADRATLQMFALGMPTITPHIPDLLPNYQTWDGCYLKCKDEYSDLTDIIDNVTDEELLRVSKASKAKFKEYCTPEAIGKYIQSFL